MRPSTVNQLTRQTDRARSRLRLWQAVAVVAAVLGAVASGVLFHASEAGRAASERSTARPVTATTVADAPSVPARGRATAYLERAVVSVAWDFPAGVRHLARESVVAGTPAGSPVVVWVDPLGRPLGTPPGALDLVLGSALVGGGTLTVLGGLAVVGGRLLRLRLDRRDLRTWAEQWARVEPEWSGRRRHDAGDGGR
ncbi:Rv1733c family protein [Streptacidiphilus rugosus]|uniref:Rv1733c family protein n=1 Tax=Streptacidiphilus rugosus TaxID=405783 RepID=UPI0006895B2A|nr:hypothetical protein [Streptacidiphilus rugosus]